MSTEPSTVGTDQEDQPGTNNTDKVTDAGTNPSEVTNVGTPKPLTADEKKQQIVDSFQRRLDSGNISMKEVEELQPWVADELRRKQSKEEQPDISELAQKAAEEAAAKIFEKKNLEQQVAMLEDKIRNADPTPKQKKDVKQYFEQYKSSLGEKESLELAARLAGLDISTEAVQRNGMFIADGVDVAAPEETADSVILDQARRTDEELIKAVRAKRGM